MTSQDYGTKLTMDMGTMIQEQYLQPQNKRMLMIMPEQKKYVEMELNDQLLEHYKDQTKDPRYMIQQIQHYGRGPETEWKYFKKRLRVGTTRSPPRAISAPLTAALDLS